MNNESFRFGISSPQPIDLTQNLIADQQFSHQYCPLLYNGQDIMQVNGVTAKISSPIFPLKATPLVHSFEDFVEDDLIDQAVNNKRQLENGEGSPNKRFKQDTVEAATPTTTVFNIQNKSPKIKRSRKTNKKNIDNGSSPTNNFAQTSREGKKSGNHFLPPEAVCILKAWFYVSEKKIPKF